jgi:hypothetical protein
MSRDYEYENNNIGYDEQYTEEDGGGIKCKNYELCKNILPKWWFDYEGNYLCSNCNIIVDSQEDNNKSIIYSIKYYLYYEIKKRILQPIYNQYLCINWCKQFYSNKDMHYINDIEIDEPSYLDLDQEYNLKIKID